MTPYSSLSYFILLIVLAAPMLLRAQWGWSVEASWLVGATVVMLLVQYALAWLQLAPHVMVPELLTLVFFGAYQWGLLQLALKRKKRGGAWWLITLGLLPLAAAKFLPALAPGWGFGFAGISYVTFRALDALFMVCDGVLAEAGAMDFFMFLFFFPTLSAGPVDRYRRFQKDWRQRREPAKFWADMEVGVDLVFRGVLYKFVIATLIDRQLVEHFKKSEGWPGMIAYAYSYGIHLFFDFAGYSAIAIGVSRWFGVETPPNFNRPFAALNIRDFWNRWHMSLSFWFRDHVYSRFLLMAVKGKWFKNRQVPARLGYFMSFGLMGLWHGYAWYYLLYGFYHGLMMTLYDVFAEWKKKRPQLFAGRVWKGVAWFITLNVVIFGFWIFSGHVLRPAAPKSIPRPGTAVMEKGNGPR